jgi:hypothetical protein
MASGTLSPPVTLLVEPHGIGGGGDYGRMALRRAMTLVVRQKRMKPDREATG